MLKNKALMCRPITEEQGVQCQPEPPIPPNLYETGWPSSLLLSRLQEVIMPYNHKQNKICWNNILHLHFLHPSSVIDKNGELVKLVPVPVPIPVPVYIPVPMHLYTQYTPFPLGLTLPVCHLCNYLKWFCAIVYSYSWIILHCYHPGACSHGHPWISRCCRTERH